MNKPYQLGDILIFKAEDDALSKCIAWLTNSDVSHSAMFYTENSITETIAPGVVVNEVEIGKGEAAYLLRLSPARDSLPLIHAAKKYLDAGTHYNFPALLYLAGLLLFRRIRPTGKLLFVTEQIMTLACLELDKLLQKIAKHPKNRSMVCSQFVYQVYYDCGKDYQIRIHNERANGIDMASDTLRLFDICNQNFVPSANAVGSNLQINESSDKVIAQLCEALDPNAVADDVVANDLVADNLGIQSVVDTFYNKLQKLVKLLNTDMPIDALFVSPGDFVYHAENLENRGEILIERIR